METIKMKWGKARELGISWMDVAEKMNYNEYAMNEGMIDDDSVVEIPVAMVVEAVAIKWRMEENNVQHDYSDKYPNACWRKVVTCPHCNYEYKDSWEMGDSGEEICGNCEKEFTWERELISEYSSKGSA